jgi:hypothetical protein
VNWEKLKTAPKDGTEVLLYARDGNCGKPGYFICYWDATRKRWQSDLGAEFFEPTHWAPLVPPSRGKP